MAAASALAVPADTVAAEGVVSPELRCPAGVVCLSRWTPTKATRTTITARSRRCMVQPPKVYADLGARSAPALIPARDERRVPEVAVAPTECRAWPHPPADPHPPAPTPTTEARPPRRGAPARPVARRCSAARPGPARERGNGRTASAAPGSRRRGRGPAARSRI